MTPDNIHLRGVDCVVYYLGIKLNFKVYVYLFCVGDGSFRGSMIPSLHNYLLELGSIYLVLITTLLTHRTSKRVSFVRYLQILQLLISYTYLLHLLFIFLWEFILETLSQTYCYSNISWILILSDTFLSVPRTYLVR